MSGLEQLRSASRFGAWFCGITLNVARRWRSQRRAEHGVSSPEWAAQEPGPEELAELSELAASVRAAVAQLADGQREAVLLFYLQGLSHREVAAELGISVGAVKARLHQARSALTPALTPLVTTLKEPAMTTAAHDPAWVDVFAAEIRRSDAPDPARRVHVMILAEHNGPRQLAMWIGPAEAVALALSLESQETPRPLTYQMAGRLLEASGSQVNEVRITRLTDETFYAAILVNGPSGRREVDARPSDAVNLALVTGAPIRADSTLLDNPAAAGLPEWRGYTTSTPDIARQATDQIQEQIQMRQSMRPPCP